ncbi:hypothetical protein GGR34_003678 [Microvirga flocculans]|uniref:Holin of 3TMs, for gene-transfer release n=1 Tax=Microvirga flocculans TaxID=217168 RepID=A0A7W6IIC6_9HYPH|nr:hypothetical protein [Microvirga flocculans]MBB4041993.1 hypothetical protein [Microvirga flocculans]
MPPIIGLLLQYAPELIGLFAGEKASAAIGRVVGAAKTVFGTDDPAAVQEAIATDPKLAEAFAEKARQDLAYMLQANQAQSALALAEVGKSFWHSGWRPGLSWQLIFMWNWNVWTSWLIQVASGIPVPIVPWEHLLGFSGLWLAIYGGGHTLKSILGGR